MVLWWPSQQRLNALPPLFGAVEWSVWSVCGAFLFGIGAVYWVALYIAKNKRPTA
jgi:hypothetical protein